jgi:mannitol-specific phosphotransferase system IIBC component
MKICLPEEVIFLEASIINFYISSLSGMWKHFRVTSSAILFTIETQRATTLCVLLAGVAMGSSGSGIHEIYFPGARGLGIHEILSS